MARLPERVAASGQVVAAAHGVRRCLCSVIAQPQTDAGAQRLDPQRHWLIVAQIIGVPDYIRAGLIDAEHHERALFLGKRMRVEKSAHERAHQGEIRRVAGELELSFLHSKSTKAVSFPDLNKHGCHTVSYNCIESSLEVKPNWTGPRSEPDWHLAYGVPL